MELLSAFEEAADRKYDQILPVLADIGRVPMFETPKNVFSIRVFGQHVAHTGD